MWTSLTNRIRALLGRFLSDPDDQLSKSRLVGIYLSRMNGRESYSMQFKQVRQRRNSRYSLKRERS